MTESLSQFLSMGGYGAFVWPAYLIAAAVMLGILIESRRGLAAAKAALESLEQSAGDGPESP